MALNEGRNVRLNGITIAELKSILNELPEKDEDGNPFRLWTTLGDTDVKFTPTDFYLEQSKRKLPDGNFGVQLTIVHD